MSCGKPQNMDVLSPIEWMMPRSYITQIICFSSSSPQVPQILRNGLGNTLTEMSHLACEVMDWDSPKGSVALSKPNQTLDDLFSFSDLSATMDYSSSKLRNFTPPSLLELNDFPIHNKTGSTNVRPVFRARLFLARAGYFLRVSVHHSTTDITGLGILLKTWASHCRAGRSGAVDVTQSWRDHSVFWKTCTEAVIDLPDLLHYQEKHSSLGEPEEGSAADMVTSILILPSQQLHILKTEVIELLPVNGVKWVSRGDILTAILWSSLVSTELTFRGSSHESDIHAIRIPVNFRRCYVPPLPAKFMGAAFGVSIATAKEADLINVALSGDTEQFLPALARVSAAIREAVSLVNAQSMRNAVQFLVAQKDITNVKYGPRDEKVSIVSWADEAVYGLDWGNEIGSCDAVRLPYLRKQRYPIVLPRLPNGNLEVLVSFKKQYMERFKYVKVLKSLDVNFI
ncbi:LAFA_0E00782g1_1 [Lachancea sp. 'fantastica']|nr:LAFA_0E00782g1_1 [Lachancea sp. 'fantastica']